MFKKLSLMVVSLTVLNIGFLAAQEQEPEEGPFTPQVRTNQRSLGDQSIAITAGLFIPLFTVFLHDYGGLQDGLNKANLDLGGTGNLTYSFFLNQNIKLGLQIAGSFAKDINENFVYIIPISVKSTYEFHPWNRISIPVHLALGVAMTSWREKFMADPIIQPGVGVYFDWDFEWSFGMDVSWWFIPQLTAEDKSQNSIGNFLDLTLTAEYHF